MPCYRPSGDGHGPWRAVSATDGAASGNRDLGHGQKRREWGSPAWMWRDCSPWWVRGDRRGRGMRQGRVGKRKDGGGIGQAQGRARATLGSDLDQMTVFSPDVDGSAELDIVWAAESGTTQSGWVAGGGGGSDGPGKGAKGEAQVQRVMTTVMRESGAKVSGRGWRAAADGPVLRT